MRSTQQLYRLGQSLWLDTMSRELMTSGRLDRYINELSVTGLTSNPALFDHAIKDGDFYDDAIRQKALDGKAGETLFFELALEDLVQAADRFRPIYDATGGVDGWVSLDVSPLLADDMILIVQAAVQLHARAQRPNLFIKIPGTHVGMAAVEEAVFAGVPVNVTLLFSREHYCAAAEAYLRGIERRVAAGLNPLVGCVASLFISRWDAAIRDRVPGALRNRLGIAIAQRSYKACRDLLASKRWQELADAGARPQRLQWASTGTSDPAASDTLYLEALAAPDTIHSVPEKTLLAFAEHGKVEAVLSADGGDAETLLAEFARAGVDHAVLAAQLQREGNVAFARSWCNLMERIVAKIEVLTQTRSYGVRS